MSPCYFVKQGQLDKLIDNLSRVRNLPFDHEYVVREIIAIQSAREATKISGSLAFIKYTFLVQANLYQSYLILMAKILSQWLGVGPIKLYAIDLFKLLKLSRATISNINGYFWSFKLVVTMRALFHVDVIVHKQVLLFGITCQAIFIIYMTRFLTTVPNIMVVKSFKLPVNKKEASEGTIAMIHISAFGRAFGETYLATLLISR